MPAIARAGHEVEERFCRPPSPRRYRGRSIDVTRATDAATHIEADCPDRLQERGARYPGRCDTTSSSMAVRNALEQPVMNVFFLSVDKPSSGSSVSRSLTAGVVFV